MLDNVSRSMPKARTYSLSPEINVWVTPHHEGMPYSDGEPFESNLLGALRRCRDVSSTSEELRTHIVDWPTEYHLSSIRHNLLRPFGFDSSARILELGCGCGAITRYLGECGATVIAVEGSRQRATIAAERCRDLPNVSVYCDNLVDFQANEKFDAVLLIGVLEYSRVYVSQDDPTGYVIEKACLHLRPDGELILAIENQLGLKYFSGCAEDHTNTPFFGIYDLYGPNTAVTFGKKELREALQSAGLTHTEFYYPFPDYKVPEVVLADAALHRKGFRPEDLLYRSPSRDYSGAGQKAFHESLAWRALVRNGLLGELANSFMVLASTSAQSKRTPWLASAFNANRLPIFATQTVFRDREDGVVVAKMPLYPNRPSVGQSCFQHTASSVNDYAVGELYVIELHRILARGQDLEAVARWASSWLTHLIKKADAECGFLPGNCLDVIPANLVRISTGELKEIDTEWSATSQIPLNWVLIRGLVNALSSSPHPPVFPPMSCREVTVKVFNHLDHLLTDFDFQEAETLEDEFQRTVNGPLWGGPFFGEILARPARASTVGPTLAEMLNDKQTELNSAHKEILRIKSTLSWQITKPLRVIWNSLAALFNRRLPGQ